jgi:gliding motility-associated-like protein
MNFIYKITFLLIITHCFSLTAQNNSTCDQPVPFCTGTDIIFEAGTDAGSAQPGPNYGCLVTQPNPAWFFFKIAQPGSLNLTMSSSPAVDIDFICYGPFSSLDGVCTQQLTFLKIVGCSYSSATTEILNINNTQVGQFYLLLITNFSNDPSNISFTQTGGSAGTDCGIISNITNNGPLCIGDNLEITLETDEEDATFSWTGPNNFTSIVQNPTLTNVTTANSGTYYVTITTSQDVTTDSTVVIVNPKPDTPTFSTSQPLCIGSPLVLTVNNLVPTSTYRFILPNGTVTTANSLNFGQATASNNGVYGLVVSVNGCVSDTFFTEINLNPVQTPVITGSTYVCNNVPTVLSVSGNYVSYLWSTQSTTDTIMALAGEYTVTVTDANGCQATSSPFIVGESFPEALIVGLTTFCQGDSILLYSSGDYPSYLWSNGSTNDSTYVYGGETTLIVTDQFGCSDTTVVILSPIAVPNAAFGVDPEGLVNSGVNIQFTDLSTNPDGVSIIRWEWFFGDGNESDEQNPIHAYAQPGSYDVMLVVMNMFGCYDTTIITVNVVDEVNIPNVFTPNNDGINDFFEIENIQFFKGNFVIIMNRWGKKVFDSQDYNNDTIRWDGDGEPAGVYFYVVDIPDRETQKGTVTLIKGK